MMSNSTRLFIAALLACFTLLSANGNVEFGLLKTKLHITVRNELGNLVEGAKVSLYAHKADHDLSQNAISEANTDEKGIVTFNDLGEQAYFVNVEKGDANNDNAATQTEVLKTGRINKVTIIISE